MRSMPMKCKEHFRCGLLAFNIKNSFVKKKKEEEWKNKKIKNTPMEMFNSALWKLWNRIHLTLNSTSFEI
jgi:hypothetical protein